MKLIANPDSEGRIWTPDESGLSARIVAEWEGQLLWSAEMDSWLIWGKKKGVWAEDMWEIAGEMGRSSSIAHQRVWPLLDAGGARTGNPPFEKTGMIRNAMQLSKGRMACGLEDFDTDCWLLNCPDGILDLTTGELLPHRGGVEVETISRLLEDGTVVEEEAEKRLIPDYNLMTTSVTPTTENGKVVWRLGDTPTWEKHLEMLTHGDKELQEYLQLIMGMALIGDQSQHKQVVMHWYGKGRNGKGVANEVYSELLGDYGMVASTRALTMKDDGHTTDLHDFMGKRWVYVEEVTKFNSGQLKDMSGGGRKKARDIAKTNDDFRKSWVLNLISNRPLEIQGDTSDGMWDRLKKMDFGDKIPTEKQIDDWSLWLKSEWPGILAWAVQGCLVYQTPKGYWEPVGVTMGVDVARGDDDALGQFLEERCLECEWVPGARGCSIRGSDFTSAYNEWRKTRYNNLVVPVPVVYADLRSRKIEVGRGAGNAIHIRGIVLRPLDFSELAAGL